MNNNSAHDIMKAGMDAMIDRADERDVDKERSMKATVDAFNAMYGTDLTEEQGWAFMVFLKISRSKGKVAQLDNYIDGAAYFALMGESALSDRWLSDRVV